MQYPKRWEKNGWDGWDEDNECPEWLRSRVQEIELIDYAVDLDRQKSVMFQRMERNLGNKGQHLINCPDCAKDEDEEKDEDRYEEYTVKEFLTLAIHGLVEFVNGVGDGYVVIFDKTCYFKFLPYEG